MKIFNLCNDFECTQAGNWGIFSPENVELAQQRINIFPKNPIISWILEMKYNLILKGNEINVLTILKTWILRRNIFVSEYIKYHLQTGWTEFWSKNSMELFATRNCLRHEFLEWFRNSLCKDPMLIVQNLYYSYSTFFFLKLPTSKLPLKI